MPVIPEPLWGLFPTAMHDLVYRNSRFDSESRIATPTEDLEPFVPLSFESFWRFPAKRERGGWKCQHRLRMVATRPHKQISVWRWLEIWHIDTDFWCSNKTPTCVFMTMKLPNYVLDLDGLAREWGFPEVAHRESEYGYGTVADIEISHYLRFPKEDSAHERLERYAANRKLMDRFSALGFDVDERLQALLKQNA